MTLRSDDLVPFLASPSGGGSSKGVGWAKGLIVSWNQQTAENQVLVRGALVDNVPILNTSEAAILQQGDVVGLLSFGSTWGILGRFTIPGTPEAVSALSSLRTASDNVLDSESTTATSFTDLATVGPTASITIGPSGRALVIIGAEWTGITEAGVGISTGGGRMSYEMSGANTASAIDRYAAKSSIRQKFSSAPAGVEFQLMTAMSRVTLREGLNPGLTTFTAKYNSFVGVVATTFANRNLTVMAL